MQSPRFITTLERALVKLFKEADSESTGELTYREFYDAFKKLDQYNLSDSDLRILLALADENPNGKITWNDFIPFGINAIQVFLDRNKNRSTSDAQPDKEALRVLLDGEIKKLTQCLQKRFEAFDTNADKKQTGFITFA